MKIATLLKTTTALPLVAMLTLAGCGGGGGGGGPQTTGGQTGGQTGDGSTMTGTPVDMERETSEILSDIFANATHFEPSPTFVGTIGNAPVFYASSGLLQTSPTEPAGEFRDYYINKDANGNPVEYNGMTIGSHSFTVISDMGDLLDDSIIEIENTDVHVYGGWMDHNYFEVKRLSAFGSNRETGDLTTVDAVLGYSLGSETGSNPMAALGSATWEGASLGYIMGYQSNSGVYVGTQFYTDSNLIFNSDATITVDFSDETLDARFDNFTISDPILHDDAEGNIDKIEFFDVPYYYGQFERGMPLTGIFPWAPTLGLELNEIKGIAGAFYGPNQEEVGGTFFATTRRPVEQVIIGAFGAKRQ